MQIKKYVDCKDQYVIFVILHKNFTVLKVPMKQNFLLHYVKELLKL